jgi:hypothetical protein
MAALLYQVDLKDIGCKGADYADQIQDSCERRNEQSVSIKCGDSVAELKNYLPFMKNPTPQSYLVYLLIR